MHSTWEPGYIELLEPSIDYLELFAVAVAVSLWAHKLQNRRVIIFCDNTAVVGMINKNASPCKNCMVLIRKAVLISLRFNVRIFATYV